VASLIGTRELLSRSMLKGKAPHGRLSGCNCGPRFGMPGLKSRIS